LTADRTRIGFELGLCKYDLIGKELSRKILIDALAVSLAYCQVDASVVSLSPSLSQGLMENREKKREEQN